jgi:hypothetical protein
MMTTKRLSNPHIRKSGCPTVVRAGTCGARPGLLFACRDTGQSVAVVAARVVTARSVIAAVGSVRRITGAVVAVCWIAVARVAVRRITVTVAIRRVTIAVGRRRDRATNYACVQRYLRRLFLLSAEKIAGKFKWYFPNVLGVLADGPIGGEPRHSRDVEHARAPPCGDETARVHIAAWRCGRVAARAACE